MQRHQLAADLAGLRRTMTLMGDLVMERLTLAVRALVERDPDLARLVIERDREIDDLQMQLDERALLLLALRSPEAGDLRLVIASIKANADLERLGDQAVNLAESALKLADWPPLADTTVLIDTMARRALDMVRQSLAAFADRDVEAARHVLAHDDEVDSMKVRAQRVVAECVAQDPAAIERGIETVIVSRNLERIADHATNMAEDAIFLVEAQDVRHHHRK